MQARLHVRSSGFAFSTWLSSGSGECRERTWKELGTVVCSSLAGQAWCGWRSDIFDLPLENKSEYRASMVNGCLPDVPEWLMKHT